MIRTYADIIDNGIITIIMFNANMNVLINNFN